MSGKRMQMEHYPDLAGMQSNKLLILQAGLGLKGSQGLLYIGPETNKKTLNQGISD